MHFKTADSSLRESLLSRRDGEIRIGERIGIPEQGRDPGLALKASDAEFVLIGIPEDIGVRANLGVGGAHTAWLPALRTFLNTQSNRFVDGSEVLLLGHFDFEPLMHESEDAPVGSLRATVEIIDREVAAIVTLIKSYGKTPLIVGGGHNNAYPILKACSEASGAALGCINMDAHSDYRRVEGRHSGNGFRYARKGGYLAKYALPWLHEAYNSAAVVAELDADDGIFVRFAEEAAANGYSFQQNLNDAIDFVQDSETGVELDLDCIAGVLSSAATPSGIDAEQARYFVHRCARECRCAYLHLTEGATKLRDGRQDPLTAKLISYLLRDFIAARKASGSRR